MVATGCGSPRCNPSMLALEKLRQKRQVQGQCGPHNSMLIYLGRGGVGYHCIIYIQQDCVIYIEQIHTLQGIVKPSLIHKQRVAWSTATTIEISTVPGPGELFRALVVLPEEQSSVPSTHVGQLSKACNLSSIGSNTSSGIYTHMHGHTYVNT